MSKFRNIFLLALAISSPALRAQSVSTPNNQWTALPYPSTVTTDASNDQQTGQGESDLIGGYYGLAAVYTKFSAGTTSTNGTIAFRLRLAKDSSPVGFKSTAVIGVDGNGDGALDVFVGVDNSGTGDSLKIWAPGTSANNSPATTSIEPQTPYFVYSPTTANYNWQTVTAVSDPAAGAVASGSTPSPFNLDGATGTGQTDYFLSFSVPFADFISALNSRGITGITSNSILNYVAATATQPNTLNQDINGITGGLSSTTTFTALGVITPPVLPTGNRQPVAQADSASTMEDTVLNNLNVLSNDADPDGDTLTVTTASSPNGTVAINGNWTLNFTPAANFNGATTISYAISDGRGGTATSSVAVTVTAVNDAPVAVNNTATATEDTVLNNINVLGNDTDVEGDTLTVTTASSPNGTVAINGNGTLNFTPAANFNGATAISYTISDGRGGTATGSVAVTVTAVNDAPVAVNDTATATEDVALNNINVLGNDTDVDGDALTVTAASSPNGTVTINGNGTLNFIPTANFSGATTIGYAISDGRGGTTTGSVAVTVTAVNDAPVATNDTATTTEDVALNNINVLGNDTDVDGDTLTVTAASSPNGTVTINGNGTLNFTPAANFNGATAISYTISDGRGGTATGSVAVTVTAMNDAPVAVNDTATATEDVALNNINVLGNDTDVDGDTLTVTAASSPNGTVTINGNGTLNFIPTANFSGATTIGYAISDGRGGTTTGSVAVTVTAVNDAPVAVNNTATTTEDVALNNINVLGNDTDVDGDALTVTTASSPNGTVTINGNGTLNFTPAANYRGATTISYTISDGQGGTATASVAMTVTAMNHAPVAANNSATTTEDTAVNNINVLGNDTDVDGDTLTVTTASSPNGTVTINGDGTLNFTPAANFNGATAISYAISDGNGGTATASVAVTVTAVNDAPVVVNDTATATEDVALNGIIVLGNDTDVEGDTLTVTAVSSPNGTVTINGNGTLNFTPAANFNGATTIGYTIGDGNGGTASGTVAVTVTAANDAPVAVNNTATATEDVALNNINVLGNDTDVDGDTLTVTTATSPNGTVTINGDGTLKFTPAANFNGATAISYTISDGNGGTATASVAVTVTAVNDAPVAANDTATATEDVALNGIIVLGNDTDVDGDALTVTAASSPNGTVTISGNGTLNFTPAANFNGAATISYTLSDGNGGTASGTVAVTVTAANDAPVAVNDAVTAMEDVALNSLNVLGNDTDVDGDTLTVTSATSPNGTVTINGDGTLNFTPSANFNGPTSISYTLSDGNGGTATASVAVAVTAANDAPVAVNDTATATEDIALNNINVLGNDTDVDGDTLTVTTATSPNGTVTINGDGTLNFTPSANFTGPTSISYTLSDGNGGTATASVAVAVTAVNDAPVAANDTATATEDTALNNINVLGNDTDVDGDTLTVTTASSPNGTVTINGDKTLNFTPRANFTGPTTISYTLSDGNGGSSTASVAVTVNPANDAPVAANDTATAGEDTALNNINVLGNDTDVDGDTLTVTTASSPNGTVTINGDGTLNFTPAANFNGATAISYAISDGNGGTATASVAVTVTAVNDAPVAANDTATATEDIALNNINVLGNDTDVDGDTLTVTTASSPNGTVTINGDGTLNFMPAANFNGLTSISYTLSDGNGSTASATVAVTVTAANDAPVAANDAATTTEDTTLFGINVLANDGDTDGDTLTLVSATSPNGTATINLDGTLNFTPAANFSGATTISYTISDGRGGTSTASVAVTVIAVNDAPVAANDTATATEDIALNNINVLGNDSDADGEILAVTSATSPNGTVTINGDGTLNFTPAANLNGLATINYALSDGRGGTATATVAVTVTAVNDAPVAANNTAAATKDTVLFGINVLANDTDVDGDTLTVTTASSPNGTVTINTDGTLNFTPAPGFIGATTISYTLSDGNGGTATATVAVTVNELNNPPIARNDAYIAPSTPAPFSLAVLANDSDLDGDVLAILSLTSGANGSVTTDGTLVFYTPGSGFAGFDTFTYTVSDGRGSSTSATVRIVSGVQVATTAASSITPSAAMLNAQLNPRTLDSALSFEYSTSPTLATFSTSASSPAGNGNALVAGSVPIAGLQVNTRYYFRAILTNEAGIFSGEIKSFLTPTFVWGPSGATTASGQLDATRIPNTGTSTLFRNVSNLGYDVAISTNGLGGNGFTAVTGTPSWWFAGSAPSAAEGATVGFRFFDAGTETPHGVFGVRFQIDDAEQTETLLNFHYFTATGEKISVPWTSPIFSYSHTPTFSGSGVTVENGAPYAGLTQSGKWVDINLSGISISGFEFQFKRRTLSAGTIIMGPVSCEREVLAVGGNFTPYLLNTDANGFASLPDYTTQAILTGTGAGPGVIVTQSPAAGSPLSVGQREVRIHAEDAQGNQANTGFTIVINDRTSPSATIASGAPTTLTSPDLMPNYAPYVTFQDNVGVVRVLQSPAPGTITSIGTSSVILTAYDAAGNTGTATIELTVQSATGGTAPLFASIAARGSAVSGAGAHGVPAGAVFKSFGVPSINGTRSVAFTAAWVKGTQVGNSLFSGNPAQPIATLKEAAPGITGAAFSKFQAPVLNSCGTECAVAFLADVTGPNIDSLTNGGVWTNLGGTLQLLARESSPAPGTTSLFKKFDSISMVGDEVLIVATLGGIGAFPENDTAVWRWTIANGMQLVMREGQQILGNHTLATFQMLGAVSTSSGHGRHHLDTGYYAARITCTNRCNAAIFIDFTGTSPVITPVAQSDRSLSLGMLAGNIGVPSGNPYGSTAFISSLASGPAVVLTQQTPGSAPVSRIAARRNDPAIDTAKWATFRDPVMNAEDAAAWIGKLSGATIATDEVVGFSTAAGTPSIIAREGSIAPGTDAIFSSFKSVALPDGALGPVFSASLLPGASGTSTANDTGLWATTSTGELILICRTGNAFGGRVVSKFSAIDYVAGSPGQSRSFNATRDLIVSFTFRDGSQSIVRVTIP